MKLQYIRCDPYLGRRFWSRRHPRCTSQRRPAKVGGSSLCGTLRHRSGKLPLPPPGPPTRRGPSRPQGTGPDPSAGPRLRRPRSRYAESSCSLHPCWGWPALRTCRSRGDTSVRKATDLKPGSQISRPGLSRDSLAVLHPHMNVGKQRTYNLISAAITWCAWCDQRPNVDISLDPLQEAFKCCNFRHQPIFGVDRAIVRH